MGKCNWTIVKLVFLIFSVHFGGNAVSFLSLMAFTDRKRK